MAGLSYRAPLSVTAEVAWDFLDRYTRGEVHAFSACTSERLVDDCRVVTIGDGTEVWEQNITVDPERMRAVYRVPGLAGSEHHQAEMRIELGDSDAPHLVWVTDVLPHEVADLLRDTYDALFAELLIAVNRHDSHDLAAERPRL
jgi:hypothetical protein